MNFVILYYFSCMVLRSFCIFYAILRCCCYDCSGIFVEFLTEAEVETFQ